MQYDLDIVNDLLTTFSNNFLSKNNISKSEYKKSLDIIMQMCMMRMLSINKNGTSNDPRDRERSHAMLDLRDTIEKDTLKKLSLI